MASSQGPWGVPIGAGSKTKTPKPKPATTGQYNKAGVANAGPYTGGAVKQVFDATKGKSPYTAAGAVNAGPYTGGQVGPDYWKQQALAMLGITPQAQSTGPGSTQSLGGGNSGGGGRGGGGGGGGGANRAAITAQANSLFNYDPTIAEGLRGQVNAYKPDIAGMATSTQNNIRGFEDERAARVAAIVQQMGGLAGNVASSNTMAMQSALRDLATQGVNAQPYIDQTAQGQNLATQGLSNQAGFMGQLNQLGAQGLGNQLQGSALVAQGAQGTLDANRQQLLNQVAMQEMQQRQQLEQAKREFMLKYGVG